MKRFARLLLLICLTIILYTTAFAEGGKTYLDESTGTRFEVPEGWTLKVDGDGSIEATLSPKQNPGVFLLYSSVDTYEETRKLYERDGAEMPFYSRAEYDQYAFSVENAATAFSCDQSMIRSATYGGIDYYYVEKTVSATEYETESPAVYIMHIENGMMYFFQFYGEKDSSYFKEVKELLGSVEYTHADAQDIINARKDALMARFSPLNLIISLLLTITIYSLPIFIYRWCIRKYPVDEKPAKIITVVYGIVAFILMSVIIFALNGEGAAGGAILLWSFVNYKVLTGGKDKRRKQSKMVWTGENFVPREALEREGIIIPQESAPAESEEPASVVTEEPAPAVNEEPAPAMSEPVAHPVVRFCNKCGFELLPDSGFCSKCGAPVVREASETK